MAFRRSWLSYLSPKKAYRNSFSDPVSWYLQTCQKLLFSTLFMSFLSFQKTFHPKEITFPEDPKKTLCPILLQHLHHRQAARPNRPKAPSNATHADHPGRSQYDPHPAPVKVVVSQRVARGGKQRSCCWHWLWSILPAEKSGMAEI